MGVRGLTTYLHKDPRNFQEYKLHNTTLIIDAANFICKVYFDSGLYTQFNGEYAGLFALVARFKDIFKRCAVRPVFVFDGCHQPLKLHTQLQRAINRLQTCKSLINLLNSSTKKATDLSFRILITPPLIMTALAQILTILNIEFVTSDRESDQDIASLAIHLNCPILSGDSDFFITTSESNDGTRFLPMRYFNLKLHTNSTKCDSCATAGKTCYFILCKSFLPQGPGLKGLSFNLRSLLACLLGNDYILPHHFSRCLPVSEGRSIPLSKSATKSMFLKRQHSVIRALIQWMCDFSGNLENIIDRLMDRYPVCERTRLRMLLSEGMRAYHLDVEVVAISFSKYLTKKVSCAIEESGPESDDEYDNFLEQVPPYEDSVSSDDTFSIDEIDVQYAPKYADALTGTTSHTVQQSNTSPPRDPDDRFVVTSEWPEQMIDGFRKFEISPMFMDPIFSKASVLNCSIESFHDHKSIYSSSRAIRKLIYGLIIGMEHQCMPQNRNRLKGVKFSKSRSAVVEYDRVSCRDFKQKTIYVDPIILDKTEDACKNLIDAYFGSVVISTCPDWLRWLIVLIAIYHHSSSESASDMISSAVVLSFGLTAICSYLNGSRSSNTNLIQIKMLQKHYQRCTKLLNPTTTKQCNDKLDIHIVHAYGELQIIYLALTSLGSILDSLSIDKPNGDTKFISLPSVPITFPSGFLFHQVCLHLKSMVPSQRLVSAPKLLETILHPDRTCDNLSEAVTLFDLYTNLLVNVRTNLKLAAVGQMTSPVPCEDVPTIHEPNQPQKISKNKPKTQKCKTQQDVIEERVARLMLQNDLSD